MKLTPPSQTLGPLGTSHESVNSLGYTHNGTPPKDVTAEAKRELRSRALNHELNLCFRHLFECVSTCLDVTHCTPTTQIMVTESMWAFGKAGGDLQHVLTWRKKKVGGWERRGSWGTCQEIMTP